MAEPLVYHFEMPYIFIASMARNVVLNILASDWVFMYVH